MRVIKDLSQGIIVKHTNIENKDYLVVSAMLYFDLHSLDILVDSKLWDETMPFLRENTLLEEGYPKPYGEFIAYGHCFNQSPKEANQVSIKVGKIEKKLDVFGDRFYNIKIDGSLEVSKPQEFTKVKVGFENAYGGEEFEQNPIGKGFLKNNQLNETNIKLHNIDSTKHKTAGIAHKKNIIPQSFEPIEMNWSSRLKIGGTYDKKWSKTRWPYFPLDMKKEFFQRTLKDQWSDEYFQGDEEIIIKNMNKTHKVIESSLPRKKIKMFVTKIKKKDYYKDEVLEERFFEIDSHLDTVMLFSDIAKGVVVFRGLVECIDDEYSDIKEVFLHTQELDSLTQDLHFYEEIKNRTTSLEFDVQKHESEMKKKLAPVWDIPRTLDHNLLDIPSGNAPQISPSPSLITKDSIKKWNNMQQLYKDLGQNGLCANLIKDSISSEQYTLMQQQGGEITKKIDAELKHSFSKGVQHIEKENYQTKINNMLTEHQSRSKSFFSKLKQASPSFFKDIFSNKNISQKEKQNLLDTQNKFQGEDIDTLSINSWEDGAKFFVGDSQLLLQRLIRFKDELYKIGLRDVSLEISHIGYNPKKNVVPQNYWKQKETIELPRGYVIPIFEKENLKKVIVRPKISHIIDEQIYLDNANNDIIIQGSQECDTVIYGKYPKTVIITDDIIKAWIINQDVWDIATIGVFRDKEHFLQSNFFKQNKDTIDTVITTTFFLKTPDILIDHFAIDNENFLQNYSLKDIRKKAITHIKDKELYEQMVKSEAKKEKQGIFYIPPISHLSYLDKMKNIFVGKMQTKQAEFKAKIKNNMNLNNDFAKQNIAIDQQLAKIDQEMDAILSSPLDISRQYQQKGIDEMYNTIINQMEQSKNTSPKVNRKTIDTALEKISSQYTNIKQEIDEIEDMKKNGVIPQWMKDSFKSSFDLDLDAPELVFNDIDTLLKHYHNNQSFKNATLYNLTLDNLDLNGADFSQASFDNCSLKGTDLHSSNFSKSTLNGTDFSNANLKGANLSSAKFIGAILNGVKCSDADFTQTLFQGVEVNNSTATKAKFANTTLINTTFKKSNLDFIVFDKMLFNNVEFIESNLSNSQYKESLFSNTQFKNTIMENNLLFRCGFASCNFENTNLNNSRFDTTSFLQKSSFKSTNMQNIDVEKSSWLEANITDCDFSHSNFLDVFLNKSFLENVKLIMCDFENTQLTRNHIKHSDLFLSIYMGCSFRKTYFEHVNMTQSSLFQADLWGIKVKQFDLRESNIKKTVLEKDDNIYSFEEILY